MHDTFTVTKLSYEENEDKLTARAHMTRAHTLSEHYDCEAVSPIVVEIEQTFCTSASIKILEAHVFALEPDYAPLVLAAFCKAFLAAHEEQNPGDNPCLTKLDTFDVPYN